MGGWGSGWNGDKKGTIEEGLMLSIGDLRRIGALKLGWGEGSIDWQQGERAYAAAEYDSTVYGDGTALLRLRYTRNGENIHDYIYLVPTVPNYGGRRFWFKCPITGRRTWKLYLPPGTNHFASRQAHLLTYRSCQESGKFELFCRRIARRTGRDESEVRRSFGGK